LNAPWAQGIVNAEQAYQPVGDFQDGRRFHGQAAAFQPAGEGPGLGHQRPGGLHPVAADYKLFFTRLQNHISSSGGAIVEMIPGTMTAGEYVIRGSLVEIEAHLVEITQLVASAHYHRMSLLRQDEPSAEAYLLRVIFNLTEETTASPLLSSQGATGA